MSEAKNAIHYTFWFSMTFFLFFAVLGGVLVRDYVVMVLGIIGFVIEILYFFREVYPEERE